MVDIKELRNELGLAEAELEDIYTMSEERACDLYNVDYKEEAIECMQGHIESLLQKIDSALELLAPKPYVDPAFRTMADYNRMRL